MYTRLSIKKQLQLLIQPAYTANNSKGRQGGPNKRATFHLRGRDRRAITMPDIKLYTLDEVADVLQVTRTLYTWIKAGQLKPLK